ncbi:hypothetical protein A0J61_05354, partial [Choanephora cucurbitarum]
SEEKDDDYVIKLKSEKVNINHACARLDLTIRTPTKEALKGLTLKLGNTDVTLDKDLVFETKLDIYVANGHIDFKKGITSGKTAFGIANGEIVGQVHTLLSNELHTSIANGHTDIVVGEIKQDLKSVNIKSSMSNGHIRLQLPVSFESRFSIKGFSGKKQVQSPEANKIHYLGRRWGLVSGYFGDRSDIDHTVDLSGANGAITLLYQNVA